jgi:hypothetical protein
MSPRRVNGATIKSSTSNTRFITSGSGLSGVEQIVHGFLTSAADRRVRFVALKACEKAGGTIRRDLFSQDERGVFIDDVVLLESGNGALLATLDENIPGSYLIPR